MSIWVELRGNIFFPHFVQSQIRSKDSLTQRRAKVVGISWSYSTVGFGAFKKNRMPRWGQEDGLTGTGRWGLAWWVGRTSWRPRRPRVPRPPAAQLPAASDHGGSISPPPPVSWSRRRCASWPVPGPGPRGDGDARRVGPQVSEPTELGGGCAGESCQKQSGTRPRTRSAQSETRTRGLGLKLRPWPCPALQLQRQEVCIL